MNASNMCQPSGKTIKHAEFIYSCMSMFYFINLSASTDKVHTVAIQDTLLQDQSFRL